MTTVDETKSFGSAHYGAPLISPSNTVFVPVGFAVPTTNGYSRNYRIDVFEGPTGKLKYTLTNDYLNPPVGVLTVQPAIVSIDSGTRIYYAGAGGTVYYVDGADTDNPSTPVQMCFYTDLASYKAN